MRRVTLILSFVTGLAVALSAESTRAAFYYSGGRGGAILGDLVWDHSSGQVAFRDCAGRPHSLQFANIFWTANRCDGTQGGKIINSGDLVALDTSSGTLNIIKRNGQAKPAGCPNCRFSLEHVQREQAQWNRWLAQMCQHYKGSKRKPQLFVPKGVIRD